MLTDLGQLARAGRLDWLGAALIIARDAEPELDIDKVRGQLGALCSPLLDKRLRSFPPEEQAVVLADYLYGQLGFRGNEEDYEDPRNSLLGHVLQRRMGIPISLALVYVEVARGVGVQAKGVGFPGHFLIKVEDRECVAGIDRSVFVDPFGGAVLLPADLELLAERATGSGEVPSEWLEEADVVKIVLRMLNNLRAAYKKQGDAARQLLILHRMTELQPGSAPLLRDRGLLQARLGAPRSAVADLEGYLNAMPHASDVQDIQELIDSLSERLHQDNPKDALN